MIEQLLWNYVSALFTEWVIYGIAGTGLFLLLGSKLIGLIPGVGVYARLLVPIGFIVYTAGVFMMGGLGVQRMWEARVAEVQAKLAEAEAKSAEANQRLAEQLNSKVTAIKENQREITNEIDKNREQIDGECRLSPDAVRLHNRSAGSL